MKSRLLALVPLLAAHALAQTTEITQTVAPGKFLIEIDALSLSLDREGDERFNAITVGSTFLSTGLTENWDAQVGVELFLTQRVTTGGLSDRTSGIGNVYLRSKWRFFEDTETGLAAAVIPYLKLPTSSGGVGNDSVEGGVIVPFSAELGTGSVFNAQAGLDLARNNEDDGYDTYWYASSSIGADLGTAFHLYGEALIAKSSGGEPWEGSLGTGLLWYLNDAMYWDFALYRGLSTGAADWNPIVRFGFEF